MKKTYLLLLLLSTVISGGGAMLVLNRMSPYSDTGWLALTLLLLSTFIAVSSLLAFLGGGLRLLLFRQATHFHHFIIALRQGILLGIFFSGYVAFSILRVVTWWNLVLLFAAIALLELFFLQKRSQGV